jgi:hypothetical protein
MVPLHSALTKDIAERFDELGVNACALMSLNGEKLGILAGVLRIEVGVRRPVLIDIGDMPDLTLGVKSSMFFEEATEKVSSLSFPSADDAGVASTLPLTLALNGEAGTTIEFFRETSWRMSPASCSRMFDLSTFEWSGTVTHVFGIF